MKYFSCLLICLGMAFKASTQQATLPSSLQVFIDCNNYGNDCYDAYVRQEIPIVNFMRDRLDADVHIIAKANYNNTGAQTNTFFVIGQKSFSKLADTINYTIPLNSTDQEMRDLWVKQIKNALLPYLAKTQLIDKLNISFEQTENKAKSDTFQIDPYDFWVFQIGLNGSMAGNQVYNELSANGYITANRETDISKSNVYVNANEQFSRYNDQGTIYKYEYQEFSLGGSYMKKMTNHFASGVQGDFKNSIYSNLKKQFTVGPVVELSVFPYPEFNTRRLVLQYAVDARHNTYYDTTIYLKTKEALFAQEAACIASFTQKWGSVNMGIFWRNLFTDFSKNSLGFNGAITARVAKGLNFAIWGNYSFIRNQLNIRKGDASIDQLLAKNREILSSFDYNLGIGLSYRFGSKFNNAVNPTFRGLNYNINL